MDLEAILEAVKDVTRTLLYVEPQRSGVPTFVDHPFFQSDIVYDGEFFDLFEEPQRARAQFDRLIDDADNIWRLLVLVRDPYKMLWFSLAAPYIDDAELYADTLKTCFCCEEWPSRDANVSIDDIVELFDYADRRYLIPDDFPLVSKVYRGVNMGGSPHGLSWTTERERAEWFARRFGQDGDVYELEVGREEVLACIDERGEAEVVIDARRFSPRLVG